MTLSDAVKAVMICAGWPKDGSLWVIDNSTVKLSKGEADDAPANLPDVLRTCAEWLKYLNETYTSSSLNPFHWVMGFWPELNPATGLFVTKFHFRDPAKLSATPIKHWYPRQQEAIAAGTAYDQAYRSVYRNYEQNSIEPEANDFYVWGLAPGAPTKNAKGEAETSADQVFFAHDQDTASIKADTPLASRPANWLGERRQYFVQDPALNTQAQVNAAVKRYKQRLAAARERATFEATWEPAVSLWSWVRLHYFDTDSILQHADWQVTGIDVVHRQDRPTHPVSGKPISNRPCVYRCERILT